MTRLFIPEVIKDYFINIRSAADINYLAKVMLKKIG
jgi:hypothetical protein